MTFKRFVSTVTGAFIFVFIFEYIVHAIFLKDIYSTTSFLWRPEDIRVQYFHYMALSQYLFAAALIYMFYSLSKEINFTEAFRFGVFTGLTIAAINIGTYSYMPIPIELSTAWALASIIKCVGTLFVACILFNKKKSEQTGEDETESQQAEEKQQ